MDFTYTRERTSKRQNWKYCRFSSLILFVDVGNIIHGVTFYGLHVSDSCVFEFMKYFTVFNFMFVVQDNVVQFSNCGWGVAFKELRHLSCSHSFSPCVRLQLTKWVWITGVCAFLSIISWGGFNVSPWRLHGNHRTNTSADVSNSKFHCPFLCLNVEVCLMNGSGECKLLSTLPSTGLQRM
jgi:hypothetical protein